MVEQFRGSIRTQLFLRLESVVNRPLRASPGAWAAEVTGGLSGADMKGVLDALTDDQAARLVAVLRQTVDRDKAAKWTILLSGRGGPTEGAYEGGLSFKEVPMGSPTRRAHALIKERISARQSRNLRARRPSRSRSNSSVRSKSAIPPPLDRVIDKQQSPGESNQRPPASSDLRPSYPRLMAPTQIKAVSRSLLLSPGSAFDPPELRGNTDGEGER